MSTISFQLPESMHQRLKGWAQKDNVSINPFITSAVTENPIPMSSLQSGVV